VPRVVRFGLVLVGVGLAALGVFVHSATLPGGAAIVRSLLVLEGLVLLAVGAFDLHLSPLPAGIRLESPRIEEPGRGGVRAGVAFTALAGITLLALALRLVHLGDDLWLDEIVTVRSYASGSARHILSSYANANNHVLNSLLVHVALRIFGYREWAIRLPAVLWGTLTIPALYWCARQLFDRLHSLAVALLLAVSYQHIFFSQNARGYTASLLFGLLGAVLLARALNDDRLLLWLAYVAAAVLAIAAVPTGAFVIAGQLVVAAGALVRAWRRDGKAARGLLARIVAAFGAVAVLAIQLYAPVVSRISSTAQSAWNINSAGFKPFSTGFARQVGQGFTSGVGPILLVVAIPIAIAGVIGAWSVARRNWPLFVGLVLGPFLNVVFVVVRGYAFAPRFLLFLVFPALLAAVETVRIVADWLLRRGRAQGVAAGQSWSPVLEGLGIALAAAVLAAPLPRYYRIQKQPYQEALARAAELRPTGVVIAADNMEQGVRYYGVEHPGGRRPLRPYVDVFFVRSAPQLRAALAKTGGRPPVVLTTLERSLKTGRPLLYARIRADWQPVADLPGSIGDGGITIWLRRPG
jgi:hypothetical protein